MPAAGEDAGEEVAQDVFVFPKADLDAGLLAAAKTGKLKVALRLLALGANVFAADEKLWTPIHYASYFGHHVLLEELIRVEARAKGAAPLEGSLESGQAGQVSNSPLHWASTRLHLRCVWALLAAGYSPFDVDVCGNTALHCAAASSVPQRALQGEVIRTLMGFGFSPAARNWLGQTPLNLLPSDAVEARAALVDANAHPRCAITKAPFGAACAMHCCHAAGVFVCEEAAVPGSVRAFLATGEEGHALAALPLPLPVPYASAAGQPVAVLRGDAALIRPVRYTTTSAFKVADAEAALSAALHPLAAALSMAWAAHEASVETWERDQREEQAARVAAAGAAAASEAAAEGATSSDERPATASASDGGASRPPSAATIASLASPPSRPASGAAAAAPAPPPTLEPEMHFTPAHAAGLRAALAGASAVGADPALQAEAQALLNRLAAAEALRAACAALASARPLGDAGKTAPAYVATVAVLHQAEAAGVGPTHRHAAKSALALLAGEAELAGAAAVASTIAIGTHASDAVISRLGRALRAVAPAPVAPEERGGRPVFAATAALPSPASAAIGGLTCSPPLLESATVLSARLTSEVRPRTPRAPAGRASLSHPPRPTGNAHRLAGCGTGGSRGSSGGGSQAPSGRPHRPARALRSSRGSSRTRSAPPLFCVRWRQGPGRQGALTAGQRQARGSGHGRPFRFRRHRNRARPHGATDGHDGWRGAPARQPAAARSLRPLRCVCRPRSDAGRVCGSGCGRRRCRRRAGWPE